MTKSLILTVPLADIRVALESRIKMVQNYHRAAERAVRQSQTTQSRTHNRNEVRRLNQKMKQLTLARQKLMEACCPNPMDCEHELVTD